MRGKSIMNDVSVDTMLRMREEEHMSNVAIARALDISPNTVLRYIGRQPKELREPPRYTPPSVELKHDEPAEEDIPGSMLVVESKEIKLVGLANEYIVTNKTVRIDKCVIPFEALEAFIEELRMILKHKDDMTAKNEQW